MLNELWSIFGFIMGIYNLQLSDVTPVSEDRFDVEHKLKLPTEHALNEDPAKLNDYFKKWRLCPSPAKTEVCYFHLSNRQANDTLRVEFDGRILNHSKNPKYLGVTFDRSLTFNLHLGNVAGELRTRNNIIPKLAGTTWGATAATLRTAALALVYSVAEYCCPVWIDSVHTTKVDVQLNQTMRLITGTIRPTPTCWPQCSVISHHRISDELRLSSENIGKSWLTQTYQSIPISHTKQDNIIGSNQDIQPSDQH
ncbi:hypothetical protein JTB14_001450 [Gonioctena quinquepunctata]|nr:hypothetical protein JTB14_001450 [Gonioctena quinquepunctata]